MPGELYFLELTGNSRRRGLQHGRQLKQPIQTAVDFYFSFFQTHLGLDAKEVRRRAAKFIEPTARVSDKLMAEYEGIAEGSGQTLEDIFACSARYEITFGEVDLAECSNLFVGPERSRSGHTLIAQNWDWRPEVMDFRALLLARCDDLPDHMVVTECAQPGKYGLNEHGLGAIEAGLQCSEKESVGDNLFVVLLRAILEHDSLDGALQVLDQFAPRATCNILPAVAGGHGASVEATPKGMVRRDLGPKDLYWHTNHCLESDEPCTFKNSLLRGQRWDELTRLPTAVAPKTVQEWLADRHAGEDSICSIPEEGGSRETTNWFQTLCSIVMDLEERKMWVSDGPSCRRPYQEFALP